MCEDQRGTQRSKLLQNATTSFGGGAVSYTVRNFSDTGAAIDAESPLGTAETLTLIIPSDNFLRACRVNWRSGSRIGVRFAGGPL